VRYVPLAVLVAGAVAVGVAFGWSGFLVYLFFAVLVGAVCVGAGVGGGLVRDASRRRFDVEGRRR
jgi:hypothetical protein